MDEVLDLLGTLNDRDVPHCVLRNFGFASGEAHDGDVDILVRSADRAAIDRVLRDAEFYPFAGDTTRQTRYRGYVPSARSIVTLDLYWDAPTYNGLPILEPGALDRRRRVEGIYVPAPADYFVELVFHPALNKNRYRSEYRAELDRLRGSVDPDAVRAHAEGLFGTPGRRAIDSALDGEYAAVLDAKWRLVAAGLERRPALAARFGWNLVGRRKLLRPARSVARRLGVGETPTVAVVGPDGVGKSTAIAGIEAALEDGGIDTRTAALGLHSGATPFLRAVRWAYNRLSGTDSQSAARDRGTATLGSRASAPKATVPVVDWLLRYALARAGDADVILADRYLHELAVYAEPERFEWLLDRFEPSQGYVLDDAHERLAARSEFDAESVATFRTRLETLDWKRVPVESDPAATVDALLKRIVPKLLASLSDSERF